MTSLTYEDAEKIALQAIHAGRIWYTADPDELEAAITAWNTRLREAELEAEVGRLREGVRRALTYMDPMSPGHSSHKMADARRVLQTAISHPKGADE